MFYWEVTNLVKGIRLCPFSIRPWILPVKNAKAKGSAVVDWRSKLRCKDYFIVHVYPVRVYMLDA